MERDYAAAAASVALAEHRVAFGLAAASVALGLAENEGSNPFGLAAGRTEYRVAFGMAEASVALGLAAVASGFPAASHVAFGMAEASVAFGMAALRPDYSVYSFPYLIILLTRHV